MRAGRRGILIAQAEYSMEPTTRCKQRTTEASRRAVSSSGVGAWALAALKDQEAYRWGASSGLIERERWKCMRTASIYPGIKSLQVRCV